MSGDSGSLADVVDAAVPMVVCDERVELAGIGGVFSDNHAGGRLVAEHFLSIGVGKPAMIVGIASLPTSTERATGFIEGLEASGRRLPARRIARAPYTREAGRTAVRTLLAADPAIDGIFATNDLMAIGVIEELESMGRRVPEDVVVCGFDGIELGDMIRPRLTTVSQQSYQMGVEAVRLLLGMAYHNAPPRDVVLSVSLQVKESSRRGFTGN
jgi:LacI family transcriptional regulator